MAVVFISPKQRQKMFFAAITIMFALILVIVFLVVFLSKPKVSSVELVFNKPKVNIDLKIFDSDQFKNLQPFSAMEILYSYKAITKDNKPTQGFISAGSVEQVREILTSEELRVSEIKEVGIGRENPFAPYYSTAPTP